MTAVRAHDEDQMVESSQWTAEMSMETATPGLRTFRSKLIDAIMTSNAFSVWWKQFVDHHFSPIRVTGIRRRPEELDLMSSASRFG